MVLFTFFVGSKVTIDWFQLISKLIKYGLTVKICLVNAGHNMQHV